MFPTSIPPPVGHWGKNLLANLDNNFSKKIRKRHCSIANKSSKNKNNRSNKNNKYSKNENISMEQKGSLLRSRSLFRHVTLRTAV